VATEQLVDLDAVFEILLYAPCNMADTHDKSAGRLHRNMLNAKPKP